MANSPPARSVGRSNGTDRLLLEQTVNVTGRLAHDFGNCLTGILGFAELSAKQVPDGSLAQRYLKEVCQSAQSAARWVQRLHLLSRGRPPCFEPADLAAVVRAEEDRLRPLLRGSSFMASLAGGLPPLNIHSECLRQVIAELLDNAREALSARGVVTLTARPMQLSDDDCRELVGSCEPGPHADVAISDTGVGLPPQLQPNLGTDFFYSTKPRNRGLGLAIVRSIIQNYQGGLRFGPHPDQGTAVHIFLPLAPAFTPEPEAARPTSN